MLNIKHDFASIYDREVNESAQQGQVSEVCPFSFVLAHKLHTHSRLKSFFKSCFYTC